MPPKKPPPQEETLPAPAASTGLMSIIERFASDPEVTPDKLSQMLDVYERWERMENRKRFYESLTKFSLNPPKLVKGSRVDYTNRSGVRTNYTYVNIADVVDATKARLAEHGFSFRWEPNESAERILGMTCVLTHESGHEERAYRSAPPDETGNKNAIQQKASTHSYLWRYTLLDVTGLAAGDDDDDGNSFGGRRAPVDDDYDPAANFHLRGASTQRPKEEPRTVEGQARTRVTEGELMEYEEKLKEVKTIDGLNNELALLDQERAPRSKRNVLWTKVKEDGWAIFRPDEHKFVLVEPVSDSEDIESRLFEGEEE